MKSIDIVVPAFNEEGCLEPFYERLRPVLDGLPYRFRVLIVDDGSDDHTPEVCERLVARDPRVGVLRLSRNFGHQAALTAGLDQAGADAVITMDADLQHPPEALPDFLNAWADGAELVSGVRASKQRARLFKRLTSLVFYKVLNLVSPVKITENAPDFRLLDQKVVRALRDLREQSRFLRGMYAWVGFRQVEVKYDEHLRTAGQSHYRNRDMFLFALSAVLSFSRAPLRLATLFGLLVSGLAFAFGVYALIQNLVFHEVIRGWTSLAVLLSFLSGVQLLTLGVLGEYLGQVLEETKRRPLYLVADARLPELHGSHRPNDDQERGDPG
ncbi:MAG: glycosyltransferase family 2 protein [Myxococcales bacterium]|nr:glycosyltransferase family 2 protein [Myxococcales bacterium]